MDAEQPRRRYGLEFLAVIGGCLAALAVVAILIALTNDGSGAG